MAKFQMVTRRLFGFSNSARLNPALMEALHASIINCDVCREIVKEVDPISEGGDYVESTGFPGKTVQKLGAHFKAHWKDDFELVDLARRC